MADAYSPTLDSDLNQGYPSPVLLDTSVLLVQRSPYPKLFPEAIAGYNQDYPAVMRKNVPSMVQTAPFPKILPTVVPGYNQDYPVIKDTDITTVLVQRKPYPYIIPCVEANWNEDYPVVNYVNVLDVLVQARPHPKILPSMDEPDVIEGYPGKGEKLTYWGAGSNIPTLEELEIPRTVKFICDYAFYNTGITRVRLAKDCEYFRHSFPPGTKIAFYKD